MQICKNHWDRLKSLIEDTELSQFIAKDGKEAMEETLKEISGETHRPDPLMMCNNALWSRAIETFGLDVIPGNVCPVCYANENYPDKDEELTGDFWIRTLVPHIKEMFIQRGLINRN